MEEYNDKSKTMEFTPMHKEKPHVERTENSIYSQARRNTSQHSSRRKKDNTTKILAITSVVLAVLIILAVTVAILVINMESLKGNDQNISENPPIESLFEEEEEELPPEEEINDYSLVFCSDSVTEDGEAYIVLADLYDSDLQNKENRKLYITE